LIDESHASAATRDKGIKTGNMEEYTATNKNIEISNPDKVLFPDIGFTKSDLVGYYTSISSHMLRHLRQRPVNMKRAPDGIRGESFYQQRAGNYFPSWVETVEVTKSDGGSITHIICDDKKTLAVMANLACITIHIWLSRTSSLGNPDKIIFDLDPPEGKGFDLVKFGARKLREYFEHRSIRSFVMTTGSRGLHVAIPIKPENGFERIRKYTKKIGRELSDRYPDKLTIRQQKDKRRGRLFMDYMRNSYGITSVCPYSIRLLDEAPVAAPLDWDELGDSNITARSWTVGNIFKRLGQREDPWKDIYRHRISIDKYMDDY
jgi:bifunctional non-homologous end joining protein LigD